MDRLEIRRRNLLRPGEEVRPGGKPLDADLIGDVEKAAAEVGWSDSSADVYPRAAEAVPRGRHRRGRGVSVGLLAAGAEPVSMATVRMGPDGSVTVLVGTTELGQGARTVMAQIAAGVLNSPVSKVCPPLSRSRRPVGGAPGGEPRRGRGASGHGQDELRPGNREPRRGSATTGCRCCCSRWR